MKSISCIIVGSEVSVITILEKYMRRLIGIRVDATFIDPSAAIDFLNKNRVALLILDMQVVGKNSLDYLSTIKEQPAVVLVGDSLDEFPANAGPSVVGFVEKPVQFEPFVTNIQRAMELILQQGIGIEPGYLFLKENKKMVRVNLSSIVYVESFKDYLVVHCPEKEVRIRLSMSALESKLDKANFIRIHKSYLIAVEKIESFSTLAVELKGIELPIGRTYQKAVLSILSERFCLK